MASYVSLAEFRLLTTMPPEQVDRLETVHPGWVQAQLDDRSNWVSSRLAKRYTVPFTAPYSPMVKGWVAQLVTLRAYLHHGIVATDEQLQAIQAEAVRAQEELKEAADGQLALIDLAPSDQSRDVVRYGGVHSYSEASPYVQHDVQRRAAEREDSSGRGSGS